MRLRLLKVLVQPVFVLDDGETMTEKIGDPVEISAGEWATFPEDLEAERADAEARMNEAE